MLGVLVVGALQKGGNTEPKDLWHTSFEALGVRRYRTHAMDQDRVDASCKGGGLIVFVEFEALNGIVGLVGFMVVYRVWGL